MNFRKDIYERVKYIMKEQSEMKVNCSKLGRQFKPVRALILPLTTTLLGIGRRATR